ncbi:MAG: YgeY family selenium metabolism-linked hydrolase [Anaerolineales bacterium]|nr:YgeY family selenium metabolism-linked hydrolase [Anaerolineales bacterium]
MPINFDALTALLQAMVRLHTPPGEEKPLIELLAGEMRRLGFDRVWVNAEGSLIGLLEGAQPGPTLLLDTHGDTVGVAPGVPWQHDPFGADIEGSRMYGRGTSDMKGALAAMIFAALAAERSRLAGRVAISVTVMEEVLEGIALKTVMDEVKPDFVVIGESTELNLNHGGRGRAEIHLETIGRPAHSSSPHLGLNAVHLMLPAVQALKDLSLPTDPLLGPAILALTDIISDPYPGYSVVPSRCRVTYDRRLLAGETRESVLGAIQQLPELAGVKVTIAQGEHTTYTGATLRHEKFFPAWKFAPNHPFVETALAGLRAAGLNPGLGAYRFCTNAAYSAGMAGVPTIGFGPSSEGHAHVVDEHIELEQLFSAARGYLGIIESILKAMS